MNPITLPIEANITRCLGHGDKPREWCKYHANCAAHETIKHDSGITPPVVNRKCQTELFAAYLPLEGLPVHDSDSEGGEL